MIPWPGERLDQFSPLQVQYMYSASASDRYIGVIVQRFKGLLSKAQQAYTQK